MGRQTSSLSLPIKVPPPSAIYAETSCKERGRVRYRMKWTVLLNDKAGPEGDRDSPVERLHALAAAGGIEANIQTCAPQRIGEEIIRAVKQRPDAIIVGGGDGTIHTAAAALADTGIPLGVLPLGTLNHFAKDLKIPLDCDDAFQALLQGRPTAVDIAEVNGHVFINNCSLGSYAEAVRRRDQLRRERPQGKMWAMFFASYQTFRRFHRMQLRVSSASQSPRSLRTPLLVVANNRYSGHVLDPNLRDRLDEGKLWVYTAHVHRPLAALQMAWQSLIRRLDAADALASEPVSDLTIERNHEFVPVAVDGEIVELTFPLQFRIRPRALLVLVPAPPPEKEDQ